MKTGMFNPKGHSVTGPGGWYCPCCGPSPKRRKKKAKQHKKRIIRMLKKYYDSF